MFWLEEEDVVGIFITTYLPQLWFKVPNKPAEQFLKEEFIEKTLVINRISVNDCTIFPILPNTLI